MAKRADKNLLKAVLEPRKPGALQKIGEAIAAGADPNGICPPTSTSMGPVVGGSTLLTHSIDAWNSNAVKKLLQCGADPNLADENGWTPWVMSTLADESKRDRIQEALLEHGAERRGDHIGQLARAIYDGSVEQAEQLIESDGDMKLLSTFRVDLVGHAVSADNAPMLEFLLQRGMTSSSTNLLNAVRATKPEALEVLLRHGQAPEEPKDNDTPLMVAAAIGDMRIVQTLVEAGADVNRHERDSAEWTPAFYARKSGHKEVAEWLEARMSEEIKEALAKQKADRDPKYEKLYEQATAGEGLSTDEIVAALARWDSELGVTVLEAGPDTLGVEFSKLPDDHEGLVQEVLNLCPDACDWEKDLRKELAKNRKLHLWWD